MKWAAIHSAFLTPGRFAIGFLLLCALGSISRGQLIHRSEFKPEKDGMQGEEKYEREIEIGPGVKFDAAVEVTAKGNGTLRVANLDKLRVLDEHDDGALYVGGLLHVEFVDITNDGYKDLVITGTVIHTGDKETDPRTYETVTSIYVFDPKKKEFHLAAHCPAALAHRALAERAGFPGHYRGPAGLVA